MADVIFNTPKGQTIGRELLIACINTGTTTSPVWSIIGNRVTDSSEDFDWGEDTSQDIVGQTHSTMKKPVITQSFDPWELDSGDDAQTLIWRLAVKEQNAQALANQDMLIIHTYADFAERYSSCMVKPSSLGGEGGGNIGMPIDVTYGGQRTLGTATREDGVITFIPEGSENA